MAELEAWIRRVDPLSRPRLLSSSLADLPGALGATHESPRFDVILGLGVEPPSPEWMDALRAFAAPGARWALAFRRPAPVPLAEWLSEAPRELRERVASLPAFSARGASGEAWEARLRTAGRRVERVTRVYPDRRRLSPTQAREWLARASEEGGALAPARAAFDVEPWSALTSAVVEHLSGGARDFPAGYDILTVE
jgi:hypothetical protein